MVNSPAYVLIVFFHYCYLLTFRDNVEWSEEQKKLAEDAVCKNSQVKFTKEQLDVIEAEQPTKWDQFYGIHSNRFFKDRHWLFTEFPELVPNKKDAPERVFSQDDDIVNKINSLNVAEGETESRRIFEIGSGVGNSKLYRNLFY